MTDYVPLPLYSDEDWQYQVSLQGNTYTFRCYYNSKAALWFFDLSYENGDPLLNGIGLVPNYPITVDYALQDLDGYFLLEEIETINTEKYKSNPTDLSQYYRLYYIYNLEE